MNTFIPAVKQAPKGVIPQSTTSGNNALSGMTLQEVIEACQWKITAGKGVDRAWTGDTFLNMLLPKLFTTSSDGNELQPVNFAHANFDNVEDSVAVKLAEHLSLELLKNGSITDLQYFFKLIDSRTKTTIATDMPAYEERPDRSGDLPDFLKADAANIVMQPDTYVPDASVCAFLHIYVEQKGRPVRIASRDIEVRFAPQVAALAKWVNDGHHIQAGVVPQVKVENWLLERENLADKVEEAINMDNFSVAQQAAE